MEQLDLLVSQIEKSIDGQRSISDVSDALQFMYDELHTKILPIVQNEFYTEAVVYVGERDRMNDKLFVLANDTIRTLRQIFSKMDCASVKIMSSLNAKLNLIGESDIDIGLLVDGLNNKDMTLNIELFDSIKSMIELQTPFRFDHVFNEINPDNRYYSFVLIVDCVEIEVKVRDNLSSQSILKLHNYLDDVLDGEAKVLITYAKFLLKKHEKEHTSIYSYKKFKQIIYEAGFSHVAGGFLMPYTLNI